MNAVNVSRSDAEVIAEALREGYRVTVHEKFFPHDMNAERRLTHYAIDDGARAVFCSEALGKVLAAAQS